MTAEPTDRELLEAWGMGDLGAGHRLFERHFDSLHRFFRTKTETAVSDLVQQTLLACLEGRERFRHEATFRTYLFQIARFQLYAHYRARNRDRVFDAEQQSVGDLSETPSRMLVRREQTRRLLQALRAIPLDSQLVLELWFWEDLSGAEIAQVLELPEPTVRSRLRRAQLRLREQLDKLDADPAVSLETDDDLQRWARSLRGDLTLPR